MKKSQTNRLFIGQPIPILACSDTPELALDVQGRTNDAMTGCHGAASRISAAPSPGILMRYTG